MRAGSGGSWLGVSGGSRCLGPRVRSPTLVWACSRAVGLLQSGQGVDVGSVLARGAPGCGAVCTPQRASVHVDPPMCSVRANVFSSGADVSSFWRNVSSFRADVSSFGWRCSRCLTTRSPGAMRSGRATGCNPRPWSREAGVDALARAGRCMGWEGIPRCAAFIWPSWPPRARIRPSASSIGAWWRPGSGPRWPCQPA